MLRKIELKDVTLQALTSEELTRDRPTVVALHGADGDHYSWVRQCEGLGGEMNFVAPDLPGHGGSGGSPSDSITVYSETVARLVEALDLGPAYLMGHSMGGGIALRTTLDRPELVRGLILVGTGARLRVSPAIIQGLKANYEQALKMSAGLLFSPAAPREMVAEFTARKLEQPNPEAAILDFTACNSFDVMEELGRIEAPTLVVSSDADRMTPAKYGQFMADTIKGARFVLLQGSGHHIALEKGEELNGQIRQFVKETAG